MSELVSFIRVYKNSAQLTILDKIISKGFWIMASKIKFSKYKFVNIGL